MADKSYTGVERRQCDICGEEQLKSCMNSNNIETMRRECKETVATIKEGLNNKIPMWGLVPMLALLFGILTIQWATYEKVNTWVGDASQRIAVLEERVSVIQKLLKSE